MASRVEVLEGRVAFYKTQAEYWNERAHKWRKEYIDLDAENDELRRENERLLKALAPTVRPHAAPEPEMCCGGTCVRAVCFIHGAGNG